MADSLKKKTGFALFWSFLDKGGQQLIQLIFGFILARLLDPKEFGLVALLAVFTAIANILQESGFSSALIRKSRVSDEEYTSVFYFNIGISISLYLLLFCCAPLIGSYYDKPILTSLSRVIFLSFVFNAFGIIQNINLIRSMNFKTNSLITLLAGAISGLVAITMAFMGYGVWSLVAQLVIQSFLRSTFLWIFIRWLPKGKFSFQHIKGMSKFSIKVLLTGLMNQICGNIYPMIIGKYFSLAQTGLYAQANKLNMIPQSVISDGIKNVAYPLLSKIGVDNEKQEKKAYRKIIRITAFISFPIAMILLVMAKPIIIILLSSKWVEATPILQLLALSGAVYPLYSLLSPLLQHRGKPGVFLGIEVLRNSLSIIGIIISIRFGILALVAVISIANLLSFLIGIYIVGKHISYSLKEILADLIPYLGISCVAFLPLYFLQYTDMSIYLLLVSQLAIGSAAYLGIAKMLGSVVLKDSIGLVKQIMR